MTAAVVRPDVASAPTAAPIRIRGLDGIRGLAAVFVVLNHIFLRAWPGYPADHAPFWASEFIYARWSFSSCCPASP